MKRLLLLALLVAGCNAAPAAPSPTPDTRVEYVIGFGGVRVGEDGAIPVLATVLCTDRPTNPDAARAFCDLENPVAHVVSPEEWEKYQTGDPYPSINP